MRRAPAGAEDEARSPQRPEAVGPSRRRRTLRDAQENAHHKIKTPAHRRTTGPSAGGTCSATEVPEDQYCGISVRIRQHHRPEHHDERKLRAGTAVARTRRPRWNREPVDLDGHQDVSVCRPAQGRERGQRLFVVSPLTGRVSRRREHQHGARGLERGGHIRRTGRRRPHPTGARCRSTRRPPAATDPLRVLELRGILDRGRC